MKAVHEFLFDPDKFMIGYDHAHYSIDYEMFRSDVDTSEMKEKDVEKICETIEKKTVQACFSCFRDTYENYFKKTQTRPNRIRFFCVSNKHKNSITHLSKKEIKEWVDVCQKNNVMPVNIGENFINNGIYDIHFEDLSMEMCYIYLCAGRYVQEEPYFVKGVLHLMNDHKMGFFTSFCLATYYQVTNSGHHILPFSRDYRMSRNPKILNAPVRGEFGNKFNLIDAAKLSNFVHGGDKGKPIKDLNIPLHHVDLHGELGRRWGVTRKPNSYYVVRGDLRSKRLEAIIKSGEFDKPLFPKK